MKTKAFDYLSSFESADLVLIPVPWSATASYKGGTEKAPELIRRCSHELDFFKPEFSGSYNHKIHFLALDPWVEKLNQEARQALKNLESKDKAQRAKLLQQVNQASQKLLDWLHEKSLGLLKEAKIPALVGGDHCVSEGLISVIGEQSRGDYGLLHLDAHADLRFCYQGLKHSHASIMNNVLKLKQAPKKLVQVGVRDFCEEENQLIQSDKRITCYQDEWLYNQQFQGKTWASLCKEIISQLPEQIYISLDVDVLSWEYAPGTGTPVPGGLSFNQLLYLLSETKRQSKKLLAFDVVESSPGASSPGESSPGESDSQSSSELADWNGNVSARLIYHLSGLALNSYKLL